MLKRFFAEWRRRRRLRRDLAEYRNRQMTWLRRACLEDDPRRKLQYWQRANYYRRLVKGIEEEL